MSCEHTKIEYLGYGVRWCARCGAVAINHETWREPELVTASTLQAERQRVALAAVVGEDDSPDTVPSDLPPLPEGVLESLLEES